MVDREIYHLIHDYQGSVNVVTDQGGAVQAEYRYDPWGGRLDPETRTYYAPGEEPELMFGRGYTGHEHLPEYGLFHMNARLYDPQTGRFLSPDPYVQDPANTQSYNRYAYALNNPLKYTDPSGEAIYTTNNSDEWKRLIRFLAAGGTLDDFDHSGWTMLDGTGAWGAFGFDDLNDTGYELITGFLAGGTIQQTGEASYSLGELSVLSVRHESLAQKAVDWMMQDLLDWLDRTSTTLDVGGITLGSMENLIVNKKFWIDSKGKVRPSTLLEKRPDGKYLPGVQGFRNSRAAALGASSIYATAGKIVGISGMALSVIDISINGINVENSLNLLMGAVGMLPGVGWIISTSYFVVNAGVELSTGMSIGEHLNGLVP